MIVISHSEREKERRLIVQCNLEPRNQAECWCICKAEKITICHGLALARESKVHVRDES